MIHGKTSTTPILVSLVPLLAGALVCVAFLFRGQEEIRKDPGLTATPEQCLDVRAVLKIVPQETRARRFLLLLKNSPLWGRRETMLELTGRFRSGDFMIGSPSPEGAPTRLHEWKPAKP